MASHRAPRQPRILLVDDDRGLLRALARFLRRRSPGWEIVTATDGLMALDIMDSRAIDVVVTDLDMPSMDGFALLTETALRHPRIGRMVHSSHIYDGSIGDITSLAHTVLVKPADAELVLAEINALLGSSTRVSSTG